MGGAIRSEGTLNVKNSTFSSNRLLGLMVLGGAIWVHYKKTNYNSEGCTFEDNLPDDVGHGGLIL